METACIIIALAMDHGWPFNLDVKNIIFHGSLKDYVYIEQHGYAERDALQWICDLQRSLYSLTQTFLIYQFL